MFKSRSPRSLMSKPRPQIAKSLCDKWQQSWVHCRKHFHLHYQLVFEKSQNMFEKSQNTFNNIFKIDLKHLGGKSFWKISFFAAAPYFYQYCPAGVPPPDPLCENFQITKSRKCKKSKKSNSRKNRKIEKNRSKKNRSEIFSIEKFFRSWKKVFKKITYVNPKVSKDSKNRT